MKFLPQYNSLAKYNNLVEIVNDLNAELDADYNDAKFQWNVLQSEGMLEIFTDAGCEIYDGVYELNFTGGLNGKGFRCNTKPMIVAASINRKDIYIHCPLLYQDLRGEEYFETVHSFDELAIVIRDLMHEERMKRTLSIYRKVKNEEVQ